MQIILMFSLFIFAAPARNGSLYERFKDSGEIKVFLKSVKDETGDPDVNIGTFKNNFRDVLKKRINMKFISTDSENEADVTVESVIKRYDFTRNAQPSYFSVYAFVADKTAPKSAAKLLVDYNVIDSKSGVSLKIFMNFTTDTRRPREYMNKDNSFSYASVDNINRFIYRAFYKQKE